MVWNCFKVFTQKPFVKKGLTVIRYFKFFSLSEYLLLLPAFYFGMQMNKDSHAQQLTRYPVDSLEIEFGNFDTGYESRVLTFSIWELKDGVPKLRNPLDLDTLYLSKNREDIPLFTYNAGLSVKGTGVELDTVLFTGVVCSQDKKPIKPIGVNLFAYIREDTRFMGPNYIDPGYIETDENGRFSKRILLPHVKDDLTVVGIKKESLDDKIPDEFKVYQNYPNPFNSGTTIKYDLNKPAKNVTLRVFNQLGEEMIKVNDLPINAGSHGIYWDAKKNDGSKVSSGIYYYEILFDEKRITKSMILLK